ncbi:MAG TPA: type II toxin-antitoxin system RelE/ParE family toxin [Candidatus Acidoferrum sp.]|nr:type II toxin-antitoxin system RelE/ParE family toxin [Candidatus Acidoferrum sp.]
MYTIETTAEFDHWLNGIKDVKTRTRLAARLRKATLGNLGDVKGIGSGVFEMREHFGPGWRMYCLILDSLVVIMLCGGDKDSQQRDIAKAHELSQQIYL